MKGKWYIKIIFVKIIGIFYIYVDLDLLDLCFVKIKKWLYGIIFIEGIYCWWVWFRDNVNLEGRV